VTDVPPPIRNLTDALLFFSEMINPVVEAAAGYKAKCVEAGFDDMTASMMAAEYHNLVLNFIVSKALVSK
jgi:hypothetical protein